MTEQEQERFGLVSDHEFNPNAGPHFVIVRRDGVKRIDRGDDALLVVNDDRWVHWVLVGWAGHASGAPRSEYRYQIVMHGEGPTGSLREARHTWVGNGEEDMKGYLFYVKPRLLAWAFDRLREWFDFDGDEP